MATKKQKRLEGERRQEINRRASIESGLKALEADRARRAKKQAQKEAEDRRAKVWTAINGITPTT